MSTTMMRQALKDALLGPAARLLMTAAPRLGESALRRADRWFALLPYLRVEICRRFFAADEGGPRFSIEHTRGLWWGPASADFGALKARDDFDFAATAYAPLWHHLVERVMPTLAPAARILDYGCSTGQWLFALRRRFPRLHYEGYDLNRAAIVRARALATGIPEMVFHDELTPIPHDFDLALVCGVLAFNSEGEVRAMLRFLAERARRLVLLEPLETYTMDPAAVRPSTRMLSQPALNHNYVRLLRETGFEVEQVEAHPTAFKTLRIHARLVERVFPTARVLPGKRPDRVMVDGVVDYVVIDARTVAPQSASVVQGAAGVGGAS